MPEPITLGVLSGLASATSGIVTSFKFVYDLKNTPVDVKTCLDLVRRVDEDIQYAISLRGKNLKLLSDSPIELDRLDRIVAAASESILDVGRLLEGCRREAHGGKVPIKGRMKWVLGDSTAFSRRTGNLQQQHAAINVEIAYLRQMEALKPLRDLSNNTTFENADLMSMGSRRRSSSRLSAYEDGNLILVLVSTSSRLMGNLDTLPPPEYDEFSPQLPERTPSRNEEAFHEALTDIDRKRPPFEVVREVPSASTPRGWQSSGEEYHEEVFGYESEDEDPEAAFFKDLRMQEEERNQRRGIQEARTQIPSFELE
jgi:hypothetical protein